MVKRLIFAKIRLLNSKCHQVVLYESLQGEGRTAMATEFLSRVDIDLDSGEQVLSHPTPDSYTPDQLVPMISGEGALPPNDGTNWLDLVQHYSQLVTVVVEVETAIGTAPKAYNILFANDYFCRLMDIQPQTGQVQGEILERLPSADQKGLRDRFRRHFLNALLQHVYGDANLVTPRLLHEPLVVALPNPDTNQVRQIELRLRTAEAGLVVAAIAPELETSLRACWVGQPSRQQVTTQLLSQGSALNHLLATLRPDWYTARGLVLIEGTDVTERETSKDLIQLLVGGESVLEAGQFSQANALIKQLFNADDSFLLIAENQQAQLFTGLDQPDWESRTYTLAELQGSAFLQATEQGRVLTIPDLSLSCATQSEQDLLTQGARSLLLIPLIMRTNGARNILTQPFGLVGLSRTKPYAFNQADCSLATTLIPALNASLRHGVRDRFTTIHPSVRWRFEQEAERLSLGLPPVPIVFEDVYPLYGISDIRGSSEERNRAIQQDLLTQFRLAVAVVEIVGQTVTNALLQQLCLDLQDRIARLAKGITVDAEVTLLRYLQEEVEANFPYFAQVSPMAAEAIAQYQAALHPDHRAVYAARAGYDQTISTINSLLRETWNHWQQSMQAITPHYCDLEATDGIDHMIYAGQAIDPNFTPFHLKSLRYEQLRAMCSCARQGFALKARCNTEMVITHLVLVQGVTVDIVHDETTERLFDVRGTRDTRYEIVKKRIDKACDADTHERITQPGMLTIVYSTAEEWQEYELYLRYLQREGLVSNQIEQGQVEPLQGVSGLKFGRVRVLPEVEEGS